MLTGNRLYPAAIVAVDDLAVILEVDLVEQAPADVKKFADLFRNGKKQGRRFGDGPDEFADGSKQCQPVLLGTPLGYRAIDLDNLRTPRRPDHLLTALDQDLSPVFCKLADLARPMAFCPQINEKFLKLNRMDRPEKVVTAPSNGLGPRKPIEHLGTRVPLGDPAVQFPYKDRLEREVDEGRP